MPARSDSENSPEPRRPEPWFATVVMIVVILPLAGCKKTTEVIIPPPPPADSPPTVTTLPASSVTNASAVLNGEAAPHGKATTGWFEYGTSPTLTPYTATPQQALGSGSAATPFSATASALIAQSTYYYRAAAQNTAGTSRGAILSFSTTPSPASWSLVNSTYTLALLNDGSRLYAAGANGSIQRSTDDGGTWSQVRPEGGGSIYALAHAAGYVYAGVSSTASSIIRSSNQGLTWTTVLSGEFINALATKSPSYIFAGSVSSGVYRSTDNGSTWTATSTGLPANANVEALAVDASGTIVAGTWTGVYVSTSNGLEWTKSLDVTFAGALAVNTAGQVFVGFGNGIYRSSAAITSWSLVLTTTHGVTSLTVTPDGRTYAGTYGAGVYESTDNGDHWSPRSSGLTNLRVRALASSGSNVLAGTEGGVFRLQ